ncbi:MAG: hemerythrin family protein [Magnetococcus sp. YQC-5]
MPESDNKVKAFISQMQGKLKDVGVSAFNKDHKKFLGLLVEFHELVERLTKQRPSKEDWIRIENFLIHLAEYASKHFAAEESLMCKYKYHESVDHKKEHDEFLKKYKFYSSTLLERRDILYVVDLKYFMLDWFFHHVGHVDVKYKPFFAQLGIQ